MPFLPPNQQRQSTEGKSTEGKLISQLKWQKTFVDGVDALQSNVIIAE